MISWNDPRVSLPDDGEVVAVVYRHWKDNNNPMSYEIMIGETCYSNCKKYVRVESNDFTGKGSWAVYLKNASGYGDDIGIGWCEPSELDLPITNEEWVKDYDEDDDETP
jgi:hypothetical protein